MAWTVPTTRSTGYNVTAANWNELVGNFAHLDEVGRTAITANVNVTATTVGTANQIATLGAISYEAVPHQLEFYCPRIANAAVVNHLILRNTTTVMGTLHTIPASANVGGYYIKYIFTPTSGSQTYNIASWNASAGTWTYEFGTGGTAGDASTFLQGYLAISRIAT